MTPSGKRTAHRAGYRHHIAPLLERQSCGDEGAAALTRLNHHDRLTKPADQTVSLWEVETERPGARRIFTQHVAGSSDPPDETAVLWRINMVEA
jgi:hypothetical protein